MQDAGGALTPVYRQQYNELGAATTPTAAFDNRMDSRLLRLLQPQRPRRELHQWRYPQATVESQADVLERSMNIAIVGTGGIKADFIGRPSSLSNTASICKAARP